MNTQETPAQRKSPIIVSSLFLLTGSILLSLAFAEAATRYYLYQTLRKPSITHHIDLRAMHEKLGWVNAPNTSVHLQTLDYMMTTHTNSYGLNDDEHSLDKPEGVFRIVLVGDSFLFAREVARAQALPALLETALDHKNVEVINLGVVGYGTTQQYLYLKELGLQFEPDLVVLQLFLQNDIRDNSRAMNAAMWGDTTADTWARPYAHWQEDESRLSYTFPEESRLRQHFDARRNRTSEPSRWWTQSAILQLAHHVFVQKTASIRAPEYDPVEVFRAYINFDASHSEDHRLWDEAMKVTQEQILAMKTLANTHSADFVVFSAPARIQVDPAYRALVQEVFPDLTWDIHKPERELQVSFESNDIPFLDLAPAFQTAYELDGGPYYFQIEDQHWNAKGHALATERLLAFIEPMLPQHDHAPSHK